MEHAGATFLRESAVIFPSETTANDYISRANVIFHEAAHQWFGDTVTMRWFDDLWLKEGFAEFMAYKTLERVMPQYNAWKAFYERNKPAAYFTDSTRGTTPIYQEIANLSAAKSAYGNIVYRKAPSFLRQAEFFLGPDKFQTAVRSFLRKHEYANATWQDLVSEFEAASGQELKEWATAWVKQLGLPVFNVKRFDERVTFTEPKGLPSEPKTGVSFSQRDVFGRGTFWPTRLNALFLYSDGTRETKLLDFNNRGAGIGFFRDLKTLDAVLPNYQDYGYGIFLLDDKSRDYVLKNIQNEKDEFLRSMMWGALWDSVREAELDPRQYVELAIRVLSSNFSLPDSTQKPAKAGTQNLPAKAGTQNATGETDEMIIASVLGRVSTAMTYYISSAPAYGSEPPAVAGGSLEARLENLLIEKMRSSTTLGQKITFYRAFLNVASTQNARNILKQMLAAKNPPANAGGSDPFGIPFKTKDRFDIVTRLAILGDPDAAKLLADLEKTETSDDAKRYAYAAHAAFATKENREKFWKDFVSNKEISESWIEAAMGPFNSPRHSDLSLPYLERALKELPNLKRTRKIFFVNGWLGAFIGGQKSQQALDVVNKFLADNPNLDRDLRLKILENVDVIERAVRIRAKYVRTQINADNAD
jgi:aminopeptidase N